MSNENHQPLPLLLPVICVGWLASGCIWSTDEPYLAGEEPPPLGVLSCRPADGEEAVPLNGSVIFHFNGPVHPDSVSGETVWLTAGSGDIPASRRVDLLGCTVTLTPHEPLTPLLSHRVEATGVSGFFASAMDAPHAAVFTTGDATADHPVEPPPTLEALVTDVFSVHCAVCHGSYLPPGGVDLSTVQGAAASLIGRPSHFRAGATHVVPGSHANSYLMWKLLALPPVAGDPMPPEGTWPAERHCGTTDVGLQRIAAWIDSL